MGVKAENEEKNQKLKKKGPMEVERNAKNLLAERGGGVSLDAEESIRVLELPKGQQEQGYSILTPLNPCNLRSGSCMVIMFQLSFVIIPHSTNTPSLTPANA